MLQGSHQACRCLVVKDANPHGGREQKKTDRQVGEDMAAQPCSQGKTERLCSRALPDSPLKAAAGTSGALRNDLLTPDVRFSP